MFCFRVSPCWPCWPFDCSSIICLCMFIIIISVYFFKIMEIKFDELMNECVCVFLRKKYFDFYSGYATRNSDSQGKPGAD